jgi:GntR family transcriptional regulator
MAVHKLKSRPRYAAIESAIRAEIASGRRPVGSCLPTEHELCAHFGASRFTVRQALNGLREAGMIEPRPGIGTIVLSRHPREALVQTLSSVDQLLQYPGRMQRENQQGGELRTDAELAAFLGVTEGETWHWLRGTRRPDGAELPISWLDGWLHPRFAETAIDAATDGRPLLVLLQERFGQRAHHAQVQVTSGRVPDDLAPALVCDPGEAAMIITRRYRDEAGGVFLVTRSTHPAGRFSLSFEFQLT